LTRTASHGTLGQVCIYYLDETITGKEDALPVNQYKKVEKEYADRIGAWFRRIWVSLENLFKYIMVKGKQRFTVMLIPHSEKKIFNFQISFFTLIFATSTLGVVLVGFFLLATNFTYTNEQNVRLTQSVDTYEKTLATLRDQIAEIRTAGKHLQAAVDSVVAATQNQDATQQALITPVASSFPTSAADGSSGNGDLADLRTLTAQIQASSDSLDQISGSVKEFQDLFASTPTTWPLKGGVAIGNITTRFGWTTNPFTHVGYMHTGVDIAWAYGTAVVATADGTVVSTSFSADLGNFIIIQHKYGFYTRYAHMSGFAGKHKGDRVNRGDVIGYLGITGLTTGPHLHYEVRLGSSYVNPMQFLTITPENASTLAVNMRSSD
jgi:murein DD-endopeptidase MepM/ murein hydrolase activator NlpD